jgi:hypothetical protein
VLRGTPQLRKHPVYSFTVIYLLFAEKCKSPKSYLNLNDCTPIKVVQLPFKKLLLGTFLELMFLNITFGAFHVIKILLLKKWLTYLKERKSLEDKVD